MITPNTLLQNRYLVLQVIGQGGMGAVYLANDQRLGSTIALKETLFTDELLRKAFEREARLLAGLRHPALPRVSDHFNEGEGQFLVMEYIAGDDLEAVRKQRGGKFPVEEVLRWADQLLDALEYLHTQEPPIIHRDIKPHNLKLTARGQVILLDFGLAKGTVEGMTRTADQSIFGYTPSYGPLEQIQGAGTDPRSDIYALAATMYHLMTGETPTGALDRATAVLNRQKDPLRPAREVNPEVPPAVSAVLMRAMALNREERPQTAGEMREALRYVNRTQGAAVPSSLSVTVPMQANGSPGGRRYTEAARKSVLTVQSAPATPAPASGSKPLMIGGLIAFLLISVAIFAFSSSNSRPTNETLTVSPTPERVLIEVPVTNQNEQVVTSTLNAAPQPVATTPSPVVNESEPQSPSPARAVEAEPTPEIRAVPTPTPTPVNNEPLRAAEPAPREAENVDGEAQFRRPPPEGYPPPDARPRRFPPPIRREPLRPGQRPPGGFMPR